MMGLCTSDDSGNTDVSYPDDMEYMDEGMDDGIVSEEEEEEPSGSTLLEDIANYAPKVEEMEPNKLYTYQCGEGRNGTSILCKSINYIGNPAGETHGVISLDFISTKTQKIRTR